MSGTIQKPPRKGTSGQRWNNHTKKGQGIPSGSTGVLVTVEGMEREAVREIYNMFQLFAESVEEEQREAGYLPEPAKVEGDTDAKEVDAADELAAACAELNQESSSNDNTLGFKRPKQFPTHVKNILFFGLQCTPDDLYDLTEKFIMRCQLGHCLRYAARCLPVETTCSFEDLDMAVGRLIESHFVKRTYDEPPKYALEFKCRHNDKIKFTNVLPIVDSHMKNLAPLCRVNLDNPDVTILIQVLGKVCCLSVVRNFNKLRKYSTRPPSGDNSKGEDQITDSEKEESSNPRVLPCSEEVNKRFNELMQERRQNEEAKQKEERLKKYANYLAKEKETEVKEKAESTKTAENKGEQVEEPKKRKEKKNKKSVKKNTEEVSERKSSGLKGVNQTGGEAEKPVKVVSRKKTAKRGSVSSPVKSESDVDESKTSQENCKLVEIPRAKTDSQQIVKEDEKVVTLTKPESSKSNDAVLVVTRKLKVVKLSKNTPRKVKDPKPSVRKAPEVGKHVPPHGVIKTEEVKSKKPKYDGGAKQEEDEVEELKEKFGKALKVSDCETSVRDEISSLKNPDSESVLPSPIGHEPNTDKPAQSLEIPTSADKKASPNSSTAEPKSEAVSDSTDLGPPSNTPDRLNASFRASSDDEDDYYSAEEENNSADKAETPSTDVPDPKISEEQSDSAQ